jgi:Zn-dependent metalloprotease
LLQPDQPLSALSFCFPPEPQQKQHLNTYTQQRQGHKTLLARQATKTTPQPRQATKHTHHNVKARQTLLPSVAQLNSNDNKTKRSNPNS